MDLLEVLDRNNVPYNKEDVVERLDILIKGLKGDREFDSRLREYRGQAGGAEDGSIPIPVKPDLDDFLGPRLRWLVEAMGSPYAQSIIRTLFTVIFFTSYLERIPAFGSILSAGLDIALAGGKTLTKLVQTNLPPLFGLIPLPFMSIAGLVAASVFGFIVWPLIAVVAFSRQDFAMAIESFVRIIPPPIGSTLADTFMEANRTVARLDEKRVKLSTDISNGLAALVGALENTGSTLKTKAETLATRTLEAAVQANTKAQSLAKIGGQKKALSRKSRRKHIWKTRRQPRR